MIKTLLALALLSSCVDPAPVEPLPARPALAYPVVNTAGDVYLMTPAELEAHRAQVREASAWMRRAEVTLTECGAL